MWRFNIIYKEQGTISIIELLAHKQNPLQSKQVFWTSCGFLGVPQLVLSSSSFSKTNALAIAMVRLVDASGNNVTNFRADPPWEILLTAAANGGQEWTSLSCAHCGPQPDLCTRVDDNTISIKYVDFAGRLVAPYLFVDENEDEKACVYGHCYLRASWDPREGMSCALCG